MKVALTVWRDASHGLEETTAEDAGLCELREVGFVFCSDDEKHTLTMEEHIGDTDPRTARLWLSIPVVNVVEHYEVPFPKFKKWIQRVGEKS
jgi:hypothetical protein